MAVKHIISPGIGFSPGSVKFIVTRGLSIAAVAAIPLELISFQVPVLRSLGYTSPVLTKITKTSPVLTKITNKVETT